MRRPHSVAPSLGGSEALRRPLPGLHSAVQGLSLGERTAKRPKCNRWLPKGKKRRAESLVSWAFRI